MGRKRILVFIKGLGIGGAEKLISEGSRHWDRERFDYAVGYVLPWKDQLVNDLEEHDVEVTCVGGGRGRMSKAAVGLRRAIVNGGFDLIHAHLPSAGILARLVSPVPVVYTEHNLAHSYREPTRSLNRLTYRRNAAVTAVSQPVADSVAGFVGPAVHVVPNGVAVSVAPGQADAARDELGLDHRDPLVVHVGNIRPGKGHQMLVDTVSLLPESVTVVSIGAEKHPGDLDRMRQAAADAGLGSRMRFLGRRTNALAFIAAGDVYVNPAEHEGLPVAILEALALGRPVVATAVGGVPSVVDDGVTGILVQAKDPAGLASGIRRLLADRSEATRLAEAGRLLVEAKYGLDTMIRNFENIYYEVLGG